MGSDLRGNLACVQSLDRICVATLSACRMRAADRRTAGIPKVIPKGTQQGDLRGGLLQHRWDHSRSIHLGGRNEQRQVRVGVQPPQGILATNEGRDEPLLVETPCEPKSRRSHCYVQRDRRESIERLADATVLNLQSCLWHKTEMCRYVSFTGDSEHQEGVV